MCGQTKQNMQEQLAQTLFRPQLSQHQELVYITSSPNLVFNVALTFTQTCEGMTHLSLHVCVPHGLTPT